MTSSSSTSPSIVLPEWYSLTCLWKGRKGEWEGKQELFCSCPCCPVTAADLPDSPRMQLYHSQLQRLLAVFNLGQPAKNIITFLPPLEHYAWVGNTMVSSLPHLAETRPGASPVPHAKLGTPPPHSTRLRARITTSLYVNTSRIVQISRRSLRRRACLGPYFRNYSHNRKIERP